jgi:hypothetical protein
MLEATLFFLNCIELRFTIKETMLTRLFQWTTEILDHPSHESSSILEQTALKFFSTPATRIPNHRRVRLPTENFQAGVPGPANFYQSRTYGWVISCRGQHNRYIIPRDRLSRSPARFPRTRRKDIVTKRNRCHRQSRHPKGLDEGVLKKCRRNAPCRV